MLAGSAIFIRMHQYIRAFIFLLAAGIIMLFLQFSDRFRLVFSYWIFGATAAIILLFDVRRSIPAYAVIHSHETERRIENRKGWMLFTCILLMQFGFLHEHIFGPDPADSSLYKGVFTLGGYMPYSDNADYLIGVQAFLKYGLTISISVFRPQGMFWSALLYKLAGESMIQFFYLQAIFSSVAIFTSAIILRRLLSWPWVLFFTWLISGYAGLLQGTFLTELTSLPFALLSLSLLIQGWTERRIWPLFFGVAMLALAFEMRPAVFLLPPFIFILIGWSPGTAARFNWKIVFVSMAVYLLTVMCNRKIIQKLDHPPAVISNTYGKLYQIYRGSEYWNEANKIVPEKSLTGPAIAHLYRQQYVHQLIRKDPMPLVRNYLLRLSKTWMQPQKLFEVIHPQMSAGFSIILLSLIFAGFIMHRGKRSMIVIHAMIVSYLAAALLSLPFLHAELRVMSVTQPIVVLTFVMAMFNAYSICTTILQFILYKKSPRHSLYFQSFRSEIPWYDRERNHHKHLTVLAAILVFLVMVAPLMLDSMRSPPRISLQKLQQSTTDTSKRFFLLDVRDAPRMHVDPLNRKVSLSPAEMPIERIQEKWVLDSTLQHGFYLFNAINHLNFMVRHSFNPQLVIPDRLVAGLDLQQVDALLLQGVFKEVRKGGYFVRYFLTQQIVSSSTDDVLSLKP